MTGRLETQIANIISRRTVFMTRKALAPVVFLVFFFDLGTEAIAHRLIKSTRR